jgi:hypothetical protein
MKESVVALGVRRPAQSDLRSLERRIARRNTQGGLLAHTRHVHAATSLADHP